MSEYSKSPIDKSEIKMINDLVTSNDYYSDSVVPLDIDYGFGEMDIAIIPERIPGRPFYKVLIEGERNGGFHAEKFVTQKQLRVGRRMGEMVCARLFVVQLVDEETWEEREGCLDSPKDVQPGPEEMDYIRRQTMFRYGVGTDPLEDKDLLVRVAKEQGF